MNKIKRIRLDACSMCQLQCPECKTPQRKSNSSPLGWGYLKYDNFVKIIEKNPSIEHVELAWSGEIFLNPDLSKIIKYALKRKVNLSATTGVNLNTVKEETLLDLVKYRFHSMKVAIDGTCQSTYEKYRIGGNFKKVIDNIMRINKYKKQFDSPFPILTWQFIVFGHNEHELPVARSLASKLGMEFQVEFARDQRYSPIKDKEFVKKETEKPFSSREEYLSQHHRDYRNVTCLQLWKAPVINWDGNLFGCCANQQFSYGNVFELGLEAVINSEKYVRTKKMLAEKIPPQKDIMCNQCPVFINRRNIIKDAKIKKQKFALIYPFYPESHKQTQDIPLGICHIKSKLNQLGFESKAFDLNFANNSLKIKFLSNMQALKRFVINEDSGLQKDLQQLTDLYNLLDFDVLCFSVYSFEQLMISLALSKHLKDKNKTIAFGGSYCEHNTHLLNDFKFIDFSIIGTGEIGIESMIQILNRNFNESLLKNIIYRTNDSSIITTQIENTVSDMLLPDFSDFNLSNYKDGSGRIEIPYCIGIGCANRCHYCSSHKETQPLYKKPKQIGKDIKALRDQYKNTHFFLICNFFNISEAYMKKVAEELSPLGITWATCITYKDISIETLKKMKQSGCVKLLIGLESGSQRLLEKMNKKINLSGVNLLKNIKRAGINNRLNIILALPSEEKEDVLDTVSFLRKHDKYIDDVHFILFQLNKGGYIFEHPESFGVKLIENEKDFFWKYLYNYNFIYTSDNRTKVTSLDKYPYYELIKTFLLKYRPNERKEVASSNFKNKILFYYHHFGGYGHGMRILSICKALQSIQKNKILVINSGLPQPELGIENYAKVYNLPPLSAASSLFTGLKANKNVDETFKKRAELLNTIIEKFNPDIAVIEHFPFGRMSLKDEIIKFIDKLKRKNCSIYGSVRDLILNKGKEEYFTEFNGFVIHEDSNFSNFVDAPKNSLFTGRVHPYDSFDHQQTISLKARLKLGTKKLIIVSIGGGLDGHELLIKLINIKTQIDKKYPCLLLIFTGNSFPSKQYASLKKNLPTDCKVVQFDINLMQYVYTADLFISMGGYNSINSHLLTNKPSMIFPRLSDKEQGSRAKRYGFKCYDYDTISENELLHEIFLKLSVASEEKKHAQMNGSVITARFIIKALGLRNAKIRLTTKCNFNCSMCSWKKTDEQLTEEQVYTLLDELYILSARGISFTGGEPTLYQGLENIIKYAKNKGFQTSLATNGFNHDALTKVSKHLDSADISIDSHIEHLNDEIRGKTGAYAAALDSVQYLSAKGIKIHINVTVRPDNYKDIHKIFINLSDQISSISFTLVDTTMNQMEQFNFSYEQLKDFYFNEVIKILKLSTKCSIPVRITPFFNHFTGLKSRDILEAFVSNKEYLSERFHEVFTLTDENCHRAHEQIRINANGDVRPCCYLDDEDITFGNINSMPLRNIIISDKWFNNTLHAKKGFGICSVCQQGYTKYKEICL